MEDVGLFDIVLLRRTADEAPGWLWRQFLNVRLLASEGIPVLGFTWYSLTDQVDWDIGLVQERDMVNPIGLFDLDRRVRPVGVAYRELIRANAVPAG